MIAVGLVGKRREKIEIENPLPQTPFLNKIAYKDTNQTLIEYRRQIQEK